MKLVLLWYKTRRRVSLVIQSLLLSPTHQLPNKPFTSSLNHAYDQQLHFPICQRFEYHYRANSQEVWRGLPIRATGSHNNSGLLLMKTDLLRFRFMIWSSQTFPYPRSSRPWEWTTIFGCKPSLIMKNLRSAGDRSSST